jgi:hypothetical protein
MRNEDTNIESLIGGSTTTPAAPDPQAQLRRLQAETQALIKYLDRVESLWVNLQKRPSCGPTPGGLAVVFFSRD